MRIFSLLLLCWLPLAVSAASVAVPPLQQRVTDHAGLLNEAESGQITQQIRQLEEKTGHQLAVLTVDSTGDDTIEQYATRVFDAWQLGDKQRDDGVLLVMAKNDHTVRIEVGYGLEGEITDLQASQIINQHIIPWFKQNDYPRGLLSGVQAISASLGAPAAQPVAAASQQPAANAPPIVLTQGGLISWLVGVIAVPLLLSRRLKPLATTFCSSVLLALGAGVYQLFQSAGQGIAGGGVVLVFVMSFMALIIFFRMTDKIGAGDDDDARRGGRSGGGSRSSGGGYSGGGGRSGGGGASGKW